MTTNEVLITGATGFIGKYILKKWLQETDANLHLLVRTRQEILGEQRVRNLLQHFGIDDPDNGDMKDFGSINSVGLSAEPHFSH